MLLATDLLGNTCLSSWHLYSITFFATILTYNWQRLLSVNKRQQYTASNMSKWISHHLIFVYGSSVVAAIVCAINFFNLFPNQQTALCILGLISVLYALPILPSSKGMLKLRDIGLTKPIVLGITWALVTAWLPLIIPSEDYFALNVDENGWLLIASRSFMVIALCVPFDVKDMAYDKATMAYPTLPVKFGVPVANAIAIGFSIIGFGASLWWIFKDGWGNIMLYGMLLSAVLNIVLLYKVKADSPEWYYTLVLDGLLLLHAAIVIAALYFEIAIAVDQLY